MRAWEPPAEFEEYRLVRPIGAGRTGRVWLAFDRLLERHVAIKIIPALDSASLGRFLVEARAAARIQHPNVVTLFRVGHLENRPFLVSEFVRGTSLDRVAKPLEPAVARRVILDLTRGLAAAHRMGVLHRDLKPGNVVLAETGEAKLLDFGLAKLVGRAEPVVERVPVGSLDLPDLSRNDLFGTPYYMSPEAWRAEEATTRSDIYSLGAVAYELFSGKAPFRGVPVADLRDAVETRDAPPLDVDARLAAIVAKCLDRDPRARFGSAGDLLDELLALELERGALSIPEGNPYRGLRPFEAEHRALFFGRGREIRAALERLRSEPLVLVTGDSGAGKSSLCLAGVIPDVLAGGLGDGRAWRVVRTVPGRKPLASLGAALAPLLGVDELAAERLLGAPGEDVARHLKARLGNGNGVLLYVDQLEEVVTLAPPEESAAAARALAQIASGLPALKLLGTVRSDFLTRLAALPAFGDQVGRALHLLPPLTPAGIREAIVGPARLKGVRFESDAMVGELAASTATAGGGLPLLQFALAELWEARDRESSTITRAALDAIGGVNGALARHADGVLASLLDEDRLAARRLLLRLVTAENTRARKSEAELVTGEPSRRALERLVRGRIVVARETEDGVAYEIAHEALLQGWGTVARWLSEEAEGRELLVQLAGAVRDWERGGRKRDQLWPARRIVEAGKLDAAALTSVEREFLEASRKQVRALLVRRASLAAGVVLLIAGALGAMRLDERRDARRQIDTRSSEAEAAFVVAKDASGATDAAREEAWRLFDEGRLVEAESAWTRVLERTEAERGAWVDAGDAFERLLSVAEDDPVARESFARFLGARAMAAEERGENPLRDLLLQRLRRYDVDGSISEALAQPATLAVRVDPADAKITLHRYDSRYQLESLDAGPPPWKLPHGSYVVGVEAHGRVTRVPVRLTRRDSVSLVVDPPAKVPEGFVWIPRGRFLFGTGSDEALREYYKTAPIHPSETGAYFIARHETTWAEWLAYLEALPEAERAKRTPSVAATGFHGRLSLHRKGEVWRIEMQPASVPLSAREGEPVVYPKRSVHAQQDWRRMPVSGIDADDALAYTGWLAKSGRVRGARLCTEKEWERAARGADAREYPHGDRLLPSDANFDRTYGQVPESFGPDEVGSHRASTSPFGVQDLSGNVWEWVESSLEPRAVIARGGSYYFSAATARVANREKPERTLRDLTVGLRVCADVE